MDLITRTKLRIKELEQIKMINSKKNNFGYIDNLIYLNKAILNILE